MANSEPVVIASDQSTIAVSLASVPSHAVTNAGTFAVQESGAALTALQLIDDAIVADDAAFTPATTKVMMAGFEYDDTTPDSVNEGDAGAARMSANRNIYVQIRDNAGNERGLNIDASGQIATNVAMMNGVAVTMGNGVSGTGVQRVTIASDSTGNIATIGTSVTPGTSATHLGKAEDAAHTNGDVGVMSLAVRRDTAAASSGTTGDYEPLSTDALGKIWTAQSQTEDAAHTTGDRGSFVLAVRSDTLAATSGTTGDYEGFHTDSIGALWTRSSAELADDAAFTPGTSRVTPVGMHADETATDSVDEGDIGAPRMTLDRKQIVTPQGHAAGGLSIFRSLDIDETEEEIKATAGTVYHMWVTNTATSTRWIKFYNATAANVTVGTTTPVITIGIPGNTSDDVTGLFGGGIGIAFSTAITVAATTGLADNDTGAPAANDVIINVFYA